jgi:hypothetical protein
MGKPINDTISLSVTNNTNLPQTVSILGGNQDANATPGTKLYTWNIASETYIGVTLVNVEVNGSPVYPLPTGVPIIAVILAEVITVIKITKI